MRKCFVTNSSTSPSLPFTPPPSQNRNYQYVAPVDNTNNIPVQTQQFSVYGQNYPSNVPDNSVSLYPQSYLVYSPYNVPVQYDNRIVSIYYYYKVAQISQPYFDLTFWINLPFLFNYLLNMMSIKAF